MQTFHPNQDNDYFISWVDTNTSHLFTFARHGGDLLQQWRVNVSGCADALLQVAGGTSGTAVDVVAAAHGLHTIQGDTMAAGVAVQICV